MLLEMRVVPEEVVCMKLRFMVGELAVNLVTAAELEKQRKG